MAEQAGVVGAAQGKDTPAATILEYKRELKSLIDEGDILTKKLITKNGDLTERLDMLVHAATEGSEIHIRATSMRDTLVGDEPAYRGKFRKLRVQHHHHHHHFICKINKLHKEYTRYYNR